MRNSENTPRSLARDDDDEDEDESDVLLARSLKRQFTLRSSRSLIRLRYEWLCSLSLVLRIFMPRFASFIFSLPPNNTIYYEGFVRRRPLFVFLSLRKPRRSWAHFFDSIPPPLDL